jgi:hypothetical protein
MLLDNRRATDSQYKRKDNYAHLPHFLTFKLTITCTCMRQKISLEQQDISLEMKLSHASKSTS